MSEKSYKINVVGIRLVKESSFYSEQKLTDPKKAIDFLMSELGDRDREMFFILNITTKNQVISLNQVSMGTLNAALVSPREVMKSAILSNAAFIIALHNHVSGDPAPSREDIRMTQRLEKACLLMDIPLLDHVIAGKDGHYYSFKEHDQLGKGVDKTFCYEASTGQMQCKETGCIHGKNSCKSWL